MFSGRPAECPARKGCVPKCCTTAMLLYQPRRKEPVSNGTHLGSIFVAVEGVDGQERRSERCASVYGRLRENGSKDISCITADGRLDEGRGRGRGGRGTGAERVKALHEFM